MELTKEQFAELKGKVISIETLKTLKFPIVVNKVEKFGEGRESEYKEEEVTLLSIKKSSRSENLEVVYSDPLSWNPEHTNSAFLSSKNSIATTSSSGYNTATFFIMK